MFRTDLLSIVSSLNTVFTATGICHTEILEVGKFTPPSTALNQSPACRACRRSTQHGISTNVTISAEHVAVSEILLLF
jgi:hypothetical protein